MNSLGLTNSPEARQQRSEGAKLQPDILLELKVIELRRVRRLSEWLK